MASDTDRAAGDPEAFSILRTAARALDETGSLDDALTGFLPPLAQGLGAEQAVLWVVPRGATRPVAAAAWPRSSSDEDDSVAERAIRTRQTIRPDDPLLGTPTLAVPARADGRIRGVLEFRGVRDHTDHSLDATLELAADLIGQYLRRLQAEEEVAVALDVVRPGEGLPVVTYIDALPGVSTTLYISPQAEGLTGYSDREWLDDPDLWERIIHPDDLERVLAENARTMAAPEPFRMEYRIVRRDGAVRWIRDEAELVEEGGRPVFWRGFMVDITDRKEAEAALLHAEARYKALVENIPAMTYIEALEGPRMLYVSPQFERLSGYTAEERIGDGELWRRVVHPDDRRAFVEANERAERGGSPFALEYRIRTKDGRIAWLHDEAVLVRDADGSPLFWQGVALDITERVEAERERQRLLAHLVSAQEEERSRIAVRVHDGPIQKMTAVDLRLQMLRPELPEAGRQTLDGLQGVVREAIEGMRALLVELRPPQLDEEGLATALVQYLSHPPVGDGVRYSVDDRLGEEPSATLRALAYRIGQEAIANVWKHARAGHVHVELARERGMLVVAIRDDGIGFEPQALRPMSGHIGMETMHERAEMAGGSFEIESAPGDGTTVRYRLPWS